MKREYSKPAMKVDVFEASEYVAACWKVKCNVPWGFGYVDNNKNGKYDPITDTYIASGRGCGTWHGGVPGVSGDGPKANAMWHPDGGGKDYEVFHWNQRVHGALSDHFTKVKDAQWETNKNAS